MDFFYNLSYKKLQVRSDFLLFLFRNRYRKQLLSYKYAFEGKKGLEIGGPSDFFKTELLPVYEWAKEIDGCNFSNNTIWEGEIDTSQYRYFPNKSGKQYIMEGSDLSIIEDAQYDFLLSSHNLEHIANPLKALKEWIRVIKPGGFILLILPDKRYTFDHKRPDTTFSHLISDFESDVDEHDLTHLSEILALHDLRLDPGAGKDFNVFKKRGENNFEVRGLHHHVFSFDLLTQALRHYNLNVIAKNDVPPYHKIILAQK
ncbi:methyltransferase domain-containing protein [Pedobacter heparinus]|uniref:methyltransferase domain-containing protein n=1 Tax=Pedobacter heparinus TaxID=984 RepID=UPI00292E8F5D|nr:methyltransferase domain-containing protein [Pedobacter heparinus]